MATAALPASAKIQELRLRISASSDDAMRVLTRSAPSANPFREIWQGEILLTPLAEASMHALQAFLESLDGRTTPFKILLAAGKYSALAVHTGALQAVPALGADTVSLNLSPASGTLLAGTLFTVGDIDSGSFQLFEVLEDVTASAATAVKVAPRVRKVFLLAAPVALGEVSAKLTLAKDDIDSAVQLTHGVISVSVVEAL